MPARLFLCSLLIWTCFSCISGSESTDQNVLSLTNDQGPQETSIPEHGESPELLTGDDLEIWSGVDTTTKRNSEAIAALRRFFDQKNHRNDGGDFWLASDIDTYVRPYDDVRYAEYDSVGRPRYMPCLMRIQPLSDERSLMTVKWSAKDAAGVSSDVKYVYDFMAVRTTDGVRLSQPLEYNTARWERKEYGLLTYVISPLHAFSEADAEQQQQDIEKLATFFEVDEKPLTFYSYADPADYFSALGFKIHPIMYAHATGGRVDLGGHVHSANGRDIYTHEVAHIYSMERFGDRPDLLEEGLATILGGSTELDYAVHRKVLKDHLSRHPDMDLSQHLETYKNYYIQEDTNVPYVIGALLCERVVRAAGREGLFDIFDQGKDPWPSLEAYGVNEQNINEVVRAELELDIAFSLENY